MENKKNIIIGVIVFVLVVYAIFAFDIPYKNRKINDGPNTIVTSDIIKIIEPKAGDTINSPAKFSGSARGNWFFEASFPIEILAIDGSVLGQGIAQAAGEWMTENFVDWSASVSFDPKGNTIGIVKFKRDNPSGMPENDMSVEVPVMFISNN
jgi:hypothetical protein